MAPGRLTRRRAAATRQPVCSSPCRTIHASPSHRRRTGGSFPSSRAAGCRSSHCGTARLLQDIVSDIQRTAPAIFLRSRRRVPVLWQNAPQLPPAHGTAPPAASPASAGSLPPLRCQAVRHAPLRCLVWDCRTRSASAPRSAKDALCLRAPT